LVGFRPWLPPARDDFARLTSQSAAQTILFDGISGVQIEAVPRATVRHLGDIDGDGGDDFRLATGFHPAVDGVYSGRTLLRLPNALLSLDIAAPGTGDIDGDGRQDSWTSQASQVHVAKWVDPALPIGSRITRRGSSGATATNRRPSLHARGHCSLGSTLRLDARGVVPNGVSLWLLGSAANVDLTGLGAPGNRLFVTLDASLLLPTTAAGLGQLAVVMPTSPALLGATVSVQAAAFDPAANALGFVTSNAIDLLLDNGSAPTDPARPEPAARCHGMVGWPRSRTRTAAGCCRAEAVSRRAFASSDSICSWPRRSLPSSSVLTRC
jgi:hypothetical protein